MSMNRSSFRLRRLRLAPFAGGVCALLACLATTAFAQGTFGADAPGNLTATTNANNNNNNGSTDSGNPSINRTDPNSPAFGAPASSTQLRNTPAGQMRRQAGQPEPRDAYPPLVPYTPGEFELYVRQLPNASLPGTPLRPGAPVQRFGANLVTDAEQQQQQAFQEPLPVVPADYVIRSGDEISLTVWGTVDADLQLTVDRAGRISVPRVGTIAVAGIRNADLADTISRRVGQVYKNYQLSASLAQVRPIRVFVAGYARNPGSLTINGLSTVLHAIMRAGGPSAAGSFRDIHLRRGGQEFATFDLYDLLLKGSRETDQLLQPDDVIFIGPVGPQVAVLGSVNQPAIFELRPGETLADVLRMAGGFTSVADRSRVTIERLSDRITGRVAELRLPAQDKADVGSGDVIRVFSSVTASLPQGSQNERVHVEGEVARPGDYILPPGSRIADALRAAGGMTSGAYPFGTEFTRESVRRTQEQNYDRALRDLETDLSKNQASQRATSAEELTAQSAAAQSTARLLERLRTVRPTGRIVLQLDANATELPDLPLEDGDKLNIPARSTAVGVFGSVFTTGSFLYEPGHTTGQYLQLAGGPTRGADKASIFMLRANGAVVSARQGTSFWHSGNDFASAVVEPGATIFVPEELNKSTFVQDAKDWTQILYQFGLGLAGINALGL